MAQTTLNAATVVGAGSTVDWDAARGQHTVVVSMTGTGGAQVQLEVSHDGSTWASLTTVSVSNGAGSDIQQGTGVVSARYVRGNLTFVSGTASVTATIAAV